jgi:uncharacterized membrane protein
MRRPHLLALIMVFACIGLADAWYLMESAFTSSSLVCTIAGLEGCNVVAQSEYSRLFGLPLALYGVLFYVLFVGCAFYVYTHAKPATARLLMYLSILGVLASGVFVYIQLALIKALCIYCLASAGIAVLLSILCVLLWRQMRPKASGLA